MTGDGAPARPARGALHHIDLWVADLAAARASWGWLLERLGWAPLYAERYPHAGGPDHYAAYLEDAFGHKVEVVADAGA